MRNATFDGRAQVPGDRSRGVRPVGGHVQGEAVAVGPSMATPRPSPAPIAAASASSPWPRSARRARSRWRSSAWRWSSARWLTRKPMTLRSTATGSERSTRRTVRPASTASAPARARSSPAMAVRDRSVSVARARPAGGSPGIRARASPAARSRAHACSWPPRRRRTRHDHEIARIERVECGGWAFITLTQPTSRAARSRVRCGAPRTVASANSACWSSPRVATAGRRA